tara:strand:+ start:697 stop:1767 length:1071 start_codon:yes stop_codon:yes gene_type:complete
MRVQKQSIGIDISKDSFTACFCLLQQDGHIQLSDVKKFKNDKTGFNQLVRWTRKVKDPVLPINFLMEATGVYYENLAYHLYDIKQVVHVVLPNTSKHYFSSLNIKTKTDELDAKVLSQFGVERMHKKWIKPNETYLHLRNLCRYYVQLQEQKTALGNIKHSKESAHEVQKLILRSNIKLIKEIDKQIAQVKKEIEKLIRQDEQLSARVDKLLTIKGVGILTIATIIAETLGFQFVKNIKQLASYAGYDVIQRESGTSIKGKTRISKKGNRYIRNALYFPAMVACRYNENLKKTYLRIIEKKPSKMIGQIAIQRKLLLLIYTLWRKDENYDSNFAIKSSSTEGCEATQDRMIETVLP